MKKIFRASIITIYSIMQLILFSLSFFLFASTIEGIPWFEPLTMGAYFILIYLTPIQVVISLISLIFEKKELINRAISIPSNINSCILAFAIAIPSISSGFFYLFAKVGAVAECLLLLIFIIIIIRTLVRRLKNSYY